jgi:hypothetical protein
MEICAGTAAFPVKRPDKSMNDLSGLDLLLLTLSRHLVLDP